MRTHSNMNAIIEWIDFTKPLFGDCKTLPEVLMKHFDLCIPHFLFTIKMYAIFFSMFVLDFVTPLYLFPGVKKKIVLLVALVVFILICSFNKEIRTDFVRQLKQHYVVLILAFLFSLPSIGISVVIFPRQHYIMMQALWVALLLGFFFSSVVTYFKLPPIVLLPLAIILFFISPKATAFNSIQSVPEMKNLCTQKFISYMNSQKWKSEHVIFSNILNVHLMLNEHDKFEQFNTEYMLKQLPKDVKFKDILAEKKIDIILMNEQLMEETRLQKDTTWLNLTAHPEWYQFKKVQFSNDCQSYLLIKE